MSKEQKEKKKSGLGKKLIIGFIALCVLGAIFDSGESSNSDYSLTFDPTITGHGDGNNLVVDIADCKVPDGTVVSLMVASGDMSEAYTETMTIQDSKGSASIALENTDTKMYACVASLTFHQDMNQPQATKDFFGEYGEKLTGSTAGDMITYEDSGQEGKAASKGEQIPYPDQATVDELKVATYNEFSDELIATFNGLITTTERPADNPGTYYVQVSNQWFLLQDTEKEYLANELDSMYKNVAKGLGEADNYMLFIVDQNADVLARTSGSGMKLVEK